MAFVVNTQSQEMLAILKALDLKPESAIHKITIELQAQEVAKVIIERYLTTGELREITKVL